MTGITTAPRPAPGDGIAPEAPDKATGAAIGQALGKSTGAGTNEATGQTRGTETKRVAERLEAYSRLQDTIFALASGGTNGTAESGSAIAIVRISGTNAEAALEALCPDRPLPVARQACLRRLYDAAGGLLDEALVLRFLPHQAPSGEATVELHLHGAQQTIAAVLAALGRCEGLRPALRGEFSWRALVHGKQDLLALEGLAALLAAESEDQRRQAVAGVSGALSALCRDLQKEVFALRGQVEARLEFGEDEYGVVGQKHSVQRSEQHAVQNTLQNTVQNSADAGEQEATQTTKGQEQKKILSVLEACQDLVLRSQAELRKAAATRVVFFGAPNAGKSSLFNALLGTGRAIVTAEAGTTRDTLEAPLLRGGKQFSLTDTAGLRGATSAAESAGVQRALEAIKQTNAMGGVLLWVLDGKEILNHKLSASQDLINILNNPPDDGSDLESARLLVLFNKSDLLPQDATEIHAQLKAAFTSAFQMTAPWASFLVSAKTGAGLEEVQGYLTQPTETPAAPATQFAPTLTQWRQISALQQGVRALQRAADEEADELIAENLRHASDAFALLLGGAGTESVLDFLFSQFCIGK